MLAQLVMIDKLKTLATKDKRLEAVLMYGSFTRGEGDEFSDIEFWLWGKELILILAKDYGVDSHSALLEKLESLLKT